MSTRSCLRCQEPIPEGVEYCPECGTPAPSPARLAGPTPLRPPPPALASGALSLEIAAGREVQVSGQALLSLSGEVEFAPDPGRAGWVRLRVTRGLGSALLGAPPGRTLHLFSLDGEGLYLDGTALVAIDPALRQSHAPNTLDEFYADPARKLVRVEGRGELVVACWGGPPHRLELAAGARQQLATSQVLGFSADLKHKVADSAGGWPLDGRIMGCVGPGQVHLHPGTVEARHPRPQPAEAPAKDIKKSWWPF